MITILFLWFISLHLLFFANKRPRKCFDRLRFRSLCIFIFISILVFIEVLFYSGESKTTQNPKWRQKCKRMDKYVQNSSHKNIKCLQYNIKNIVRHQRAFLLSVFFCLFFVFDVCLPLFIHVSLICEVSEDVNLCSQPGRVLERHSKKLFSINCNVWSVGFFSLICVN